MKVYLCNYHHWDGCEYESISDDILIKIVDSEEKAKQCIMDAAKEFFDIRIEKTKKRIQEIEKLEAKIGKLEPLYVVDEYDIHEELKDLEEAKGKLYLEHGRNGSQIRYEPDEYDHYSWDYEAHEVE